MHNSGGYTPQFIQVLMGRDEPPGLVDISEQQEPQLVEADHHNHHTEQSFSMEHELLQPLRIDRNFGDLSRMIAANSRAEIDRSRIRQLEAELAKCSQIQKQCQQYETLTENLKNRIKQLQRKLLDCQQKLRQANVDRMAVLRQHDGNKQPKPITAGKATEQQVEVARKQATSDSYKQVEEYLKARIAEFIDSIRNERLSKRLENIIENFLEELLQVNSYTARMDARQPQRDLQSTTELKSSPNNSLMMSLSKPTEREQQDFEDSKVKFRIVSSTKKSIADEPASVVKINDLSVRDTSLYENSRQDRDRSKSQRRRKIFS